jgi:co-chaperonin GroES (HSP10)
MNMNIIPTGHNILIQVDSAPRNVSEGGIMLPSEYVEGTSTHYTGCVIAKGKKVRPEIGVGQRVILPSYHGLKLELAPGQFIVNDREVIGFVE